MMGGGMGEWLKPAVLKTVCVERGTGVRIPLPPPKKMPEKETIQRAKKDKAEGKAPSTQAGEFVREEMDHIREGKHGARSPQQAIAIGLSKARRAGVKLPPPKAGSTSSSTSSKMRRQAQRDTERGEHPRKPSPTRSRATTRA